MTKLIALILFATLAHPAHAALSERDRAEIGVKNILTKNPGFESGKASWVASGGTFAIDSDTPLFGKSSATWDASDADQTLTSELVTIPAGLYGKNGLLEFSHTGGDENLVIQVWDGTNVLAEAPLSEGGATFIFPSSGSIAARVKATGDAASVKLDSFYLGRNYRVGTVSQATIFASKVWAPTNNCLWLRDSTTLGTFPADTDCDDNAITFSGGAVPDASIDGQRPKIRVKDLPPGTIKIEAVSSFCSTVEASRDEHNAQFQFHDGSNVIDGINQVRLFRSPANDNSGVCVPVISGTATYTTRQADITFDIHSKTTHDDVNSTLDARWAGLTITVYHYPLDSQTVYNFAESADDVGQVAFFARTTDPHGWVSAENKTIGVTSADYSGPRYLALYRHIWSLPGVTTTATDPYSISSSKGDSADADWAAGKLIRINFSENEVFLRAQGGSTTLGGYQEDAFQGHHHNTGLAGSTTNFTSSRTVGPGDGLGSATTSTSSDSTTPSASARTGAPYNPDGSPYGAARISDETRPKNVALKAFIRYLTVSAPTVLGMPEEVDEIITNPTFEVSGTEVTSLTNLRLTGTRIGKTYNLSIRFNFNLTTGNNYDELYLLLDQYSFLAGKKIKHISGSFVSNLNNSSSPGASVVGVCFLSSNEALGFGLGFTGNFASVSNRVAVGSLVVVVE